MTKDFLNRVAPFLKTPLDKIELFKGQTIACYEFHKGTMILEKRYSNTIIKLVWL